MSAETKSHIFEPFFTTKKEGRGIGLGLSMVFGIVKQHGGYINVYSEPDKGTVFRLYFPRIHVEEKIDKAADACETIPCGSETVLVVEDNPIIGMFIQQDLESLGTHVLLAAEPDEAFHILREKKDTKLDLLLTDVIMPQMSGKELADKIQATHGDLKILFMSGYAADYLGTRGILAAGISFLEKPFDKPRLARKVRDVLDQELIKK
jgi:two-component system, cell cycle sensor histidine kinase and response regulator CckA